MSQLLRSMGLCSHCKIRPPRNERRMCEQCAKTHNDCGNRRHNRLRDSHICAGCGNSNENGYLHCDACRETRRKRVRAKEIKRIADGVCRCGKPGSIGKSVKCWLCWLKNESCNIFGNAKHWKELEILWEEQDGRCAYTNTRLIPGINAQVDHSVPRARGGTETIDNLQWVCGAVNYMKSDLRHDEFLGIISIISGNIGNPSNSAITSDSINYILSKCNVRRRISSRL